MLPNCVQSTAWRSDERPLQAGSSSGWGKIAKNALPASAVDLNLEVANFLAQRIAVDPKQVGGADLVTACGSQGRRQQGVLKVGPAPGAGAGARRAGGDGCNGGGRAPRERCAESVVTLSSRTG